MKNKGILDTVLIILIELVIYLLGVLLGLLISQSKTNKYDVNNDGKVTMHDAVLIVDYYIEERNNER